MRVIIKSAAREDLLRHVEYLLERDAIRAASRFLAAFQRAVERIANFPKIGSPRRLPSPLLRKLRSWPIPGFKRVRIYYLLSRSLIQVLRVLHDRQEMNLHLLP